LYLKHSSKIAKSYFLTKEVTKSLTFFKPVTIPFAGLIDSFYLLPRLGNLIMREMNNDLALFIQTEFLNYFNNINSS